MINRHGTHIWYELQTSDVNAAATFYGAVLGWSTQHLGPPGASYCRLQSGTEGVGGMVALRTDMAGPGPMWLGYIGVTDVDAAVARIKATGGGVHVPPTDIPGIGRFAMVNDPQGAVFYVMRGGSDEPSTAYAPEQPGHTGWHELHTSDWQAAFAFYADNFGWARGQALDVGAMGTYQLVNDANATALGAMMNAPTSAPPAWLYYFNVENIDAAAAQIVASGGSILRPAHQVPGGNWIVQANDPQGAAFALTGHRL